jgi:superfamily II DNA or RNA helicase
MHRSTRPIENVDNLRKNRLKQKKKLDQKSDKKKKIDTNLVKSNEKLIDMFYNRFMDNDFKNMVLKEDVKKTLMSHQHLHVFNLITAIKKHGIALDGSETGTGKTFTAIAVCKQLGLDPIIVCTKLNRSTWKTVCNRFQVKPICIVNYELLRNGKMYDEKGKKIDAKFLKYDKKTKEYKWLIDDKRNTIVIFDEAHKCKNPKSQLGKLLLECKEECKIMMLSATLCDKPMDFMVFGYMLKLYKHVVAGRGWIKWILKEDSKSIGKEHSTLFNKIFPGLYCT